MPSSDASAGWDVVSGPGLTALGLAASRLVESGRTLLQRVSDLSAPDSRFAADRLRPASSSPA